MKVSNTKVGGSSTLDSAEKTQGNQRADKADKTGLKGNSSNTSAKGALSNEKVNLSQRVQDMQRIREIATKNKDSVDEAKVARLQALIDAGEYKVDAEAIADKLVDEHSNMPT